MSRTVVGVLRGGGSSEYGLSLRTGAAMMAALPEEKYETRDILIDKRGMWHLRGMPADPIRALSQVDVVLNALHGGAGEDGTVQRILSRAGVPYAGSGALASAFSLNKIRMGGLLRRAGIPMPRSIAFGLGSAVTTGEMAESVFSLFGPPYIVKPPAEGSSHGIRIASTVLELPEALGDVLDAYGYALVEEYLRGDEVHVGLIQGFRGEDLYALPPAHVTFPGTMRFLEPSAHEEGTVRYTVPSRFSHEEKRALIELARAAHRALGLAHFSLAGIILARGRPYLIELDAVPGLYEGAAFPHALEAVGSSTREFLEHAIALARSRA